jgi:hypothetical protein
MTAVDTTTEAGESRAESLRDYASVPVRLHQRHMADISESSRKAIDSVDSTPYFQRYGENMWAAPKGYLDEVTAVAAAPVIEKYTGVIAAADVFTESTTFQVMQSMRLDLRYGSQVHP